MKSIQSPAEPSHLSTEKILFFSENYLFSSAEQAGNLCDFWGKIKARSKFGFKFIVDLRVLLKGFEPKN